MRVVIGDLHKILAERRKQWSEMERRKESTNQATRASECADFFESRMRVTALPGMHYTNTNRARDQFEVQQKARESMHGRLTVEVTCIPRHASAQRRAGRVGLAFELRREGRSVTQSHDHGVVT